LGFLHGELPQSNFIHLLVSNGIDKNGFEIAGKKTDANHFAMNIIELGDVVYRCR
jgi:hypothetical protein